MFLVRKITQAKWRSNSELPEGEISADAVTADLRTRGNSLSFWQCPTEEEGDLEDAALAVAAAADRVDTLDIVWLTNDELQRDGQTLRNTRGQTPVGELVDLHVDVCRLDYVRLGRVARRILAALEERRHFRLTRARVRRLLVEAVEGRRVELDDLEVGIRTEIGKSL